MSSLIGTGCAPLDRERRRDIVLGKDIQAAVKLLSSHYVDVRRLNAQKMMLGALSQIASQVPEVQVTPDIRKREVRVTFGGASQIFLLPDSDNLDPEKPTKYIPKEMKKLGKILPEVLRFILTYVDSQERQNWKQFLEQKAIEGMFSLFDTHTGYSNFTESQRMQNLLRHDYMYSSFTPRLARIGLSRFGLVLSLTKNGLYVRKILGRSSAEELGIKPSDEVRLLGGLDPRGMNLTELSFFIKSWKGDELPVCIRKEDSSVERCIRLLVKRDREPDRGVYSIFLHPGEEKKIGYMHLHGMNEGHEAVNFHEDLTKLKREGLKGLVLDLRDNLGGSLETTQSILKELSWKQQMMLWYYPSDVAVKDSRFFSEFPMVVLINGRSVSGAEMVAGSLQSSGRAVVMGTQSVGKGIGQGNFFLPSGMEIGITGLEYFLSQMEPVQSLGITPDVAIFPQYLDDTNHLLLQPNQVWSAEKDTPNPILSGFPHDEKEPTFTLHYFGDSALKKKPYDWPFPKASIPLTTPFEFFTNCSVEPETCAKDPVAEMAYEFLTHTTSLRREFMLKQALPWMKQKEADYEIELQKKLKEYGIDWESMKESHGKANLTAQVFVQGAQTINEFQAATGQQAGGVPHALGKAEEWVLKVTNQGSSPASQVRAKLRSLEPWLEGKEWVLGKILPGETKLWRTQIFIPAYLPACAHVGTVEIFEEHTKQSVKVPVHVETSASPKPRLVYRYELVHDDHSSGGFLQLGERVRLRLTVKNIGEGIAKDAQIFLQNVNAKGLYVTLGKHQLGTLGSNQEVTKDFEILATHDDSGKRAWFRFYLADMETLEEPIMSEFSFPIVEHRMRNQAASSGTAMAWQGETVALQVDAYPLSTKAKTVMISFSAEHKELVKDAFVTLVSPKQTPEKIFYQANPIPSNQMHVAIEVPLHPGINRIEIAARHSVYQSIKRYLWIIVPEDERNEREN